MNMQQQINLYRYLSKKKKLYFTFERTVICYALFLSLFFLIFLYELWHQHEFTVELKKSQVTFTAAQQKLIFLLKQYPSLDAHDLEKSVHTLQNELVEKAKIFDVLARKMNFSAYLTGLSNATTTGVWLTEISFGSRSPQISLRGHALNVNQLQQFLDTILRQPIFSDFIFELQELTQTETEQKEPIINFYMTTKSKNGKK